MVFLHFTPVELREVLAKAKQALTQDGILAFSVRQGEGESWLNDKLNAPRYYYYWAPDALRGMLQANGFSVLDMRSGDSTNPDKIYVIAC